MAKSQSSPAARPGHREIDLGLAEALAAPMSGLLALGEMISRQPLGEPARIQLNGMLETAQRMARLVEETLETGAALDEQFLDSICLRELVETVEGRFRAVHPHEGRRLLVSCSVPFDLRVQANPHKLDTLLSLLMEGALDAAQGGVADLQLFADISADGEIRLHGRLDGLRSSKSSRTQRLSLCKTLAEQMGGELKRIDNPGLGGHLSFTVRLRPAVVDEPVQGELEEESVLPPRTHVLIVDDNATNRIVAAALCEMFGCTSETAEDGLEAVQAVRDRPFDLILMDIRMPRMDGLAATRAIQALGGQAARTPIVALTANADPEAVAVYLAGGMVAVVDKPIKPAQLLGALQDALAGPETMAAERSTAA